MVLLLQNWVMDLNAGIKGARGLANQPEAYLRRHDVLFHEDLKVLPEGVPLKPGEETTVAVPLPEGFPLNADLKKLNASIEITQGEDSEKATLTQTSTVKEGTDAAKVYKVDIAVPALPRNLSVRLEGGEVFWTSSSTTNEGTFELPNFVEQANSYLDKLPVGTTEVALVFLVQSDGPGKVKITVDEESLSYSAIQTQAWPNPLDDTIRLDRNLELDFGSVELLELDALAAGKTGTPSLTLISADVGGQFGKERLFTNVPTHNGKEFATISSEYALAQSLELSESILSTDKPLHAAGVAALFRVDDKLELYVELQPDSGGSPASGAPLAKSNLTLAAGSEWVFANFEQPVDLQLDTPYWIVFKGIQGKALLALGAPSEDYLAHVLVNRGGQLWKAINRRSPAATCALARLVYLPELDNQSAAIEIGIQGASSLERLDPTPEARTISLQRAAGTPSRKAVIVIRSHARGTLTIANLIQEYTL
jgi:hypothetical protein